MVGTAYITFTNGNTNLSFDYDTYIIDASGGSIVLTLPSINADGHTFLLRRRDTTANTLTLSASATINGSSTINSSSDMKIHSWNGQWYTDFSGGTGNNLGHEFRLSVVANNGNNFLSFGSTMDNFSPIASFIYRGTSYTGGWPSLWKIIYSSSGSNTTFLLRIRDITNNNDIITTTITWTSAVASQTIINNTSFANVPANESIWQIEVRRPQGLGSGSLNFYASHLVM